MTPVPIQPMRVVPGDADLSDEGLGMFGQPNCGT
jgi:hypothetical protein